jgi:hypothetical protein
MKRKGNLSEEVYKMRKLMGYDSKKDFDNVTSYDRLMEEKLVEKYLLSEQDEVSDSFANDSEDVKNHELYPLVTNWWKKHQKDNTTQKTLSIWGGVEGSKEKGGGPEGHSTGIERLKSLQKKLTSSSYDETADTNVLSNMVGVVTSWLEILANSGVYIKRDTTFGTGSTGKIINLLLTNTYFGNGSGINDVESFKSKIDMINNSLNLQSILSTDNIKSNALDKSNVGKSSVGYTPFTDADKIEALDYYKERAQSKVDSDSKYSKNINNIDEAINTAKVIRVRKKGQGEVSKGENITGEVTTVSDVLTWPNIEDPTTEEADKMNTMFGDDDSQLPAETKTEIQNYIYNAINDMVDQGYTIQEISYGGYASTSKVRTAFKSVEVDQQGQSKVIFDLNSDGAKNRTEENNAPLAQSRVNSIETELKTIIDGAVKNIPVVSEKLKIVKGGSKTEPNLGPGWAKYEPQTGLDSKYGGGYGPLYNKSKDGGRNLTPQQFYGDRSDNHAKKLGLTGEQLNKEYNVVYGPFRKNYGFVYIIATTSKPTEDIAPTYEGKSGYQYNIIWEGASPPRKKKVRGSAGGGKSFVGVKLNTTACPKPNKGWWDNLSYEISGNK